MFWRYLLRIIISLLCYLLTLNNSYSEPSIGADDYQIEEVDGHKIHLLTIDPAKYETLFVSSNDSVFGRKLVKYITSQVNGDIGVNAGFFEIGGNKDGMPCGLLVIDGKFYSMQSKELPCIVQRHGKIFIEKIKPRLIIDILSKKYNITHFNKFAQSDHIYLYNDAWGNSTLSAFDKRKEIVVSVEGKIIEVNNHGNSVIPEGGSVISFPETIKLEDNLIGKNVIFNWTPAYLIDPGTSVVLGIPQLIENGKAIKELDNTSPNARTAFGIKEDGKYLVVVIEHVHLPDINDLSKIIKKENLSVNNKTMDNLHNFIVKRLKTTPGKNSQIIGMTTKELAEYMLSKGCVDAINLDGGGSSSLYLNDKFVNTVFGDIDENQGFQLHRAVSNALVFKRKQIP